MEQEELFDKYCEYQRYLLRREEWCNYENMQQDSQESTVLCEPLVLAELNRLVPYMEGEEVKFHPVNMPYLKIGRIEIVGFVVSVKDDGQFYELTVDDGTGMIDVRYKKETYLKVIKHRRLITDRYRRYAMDIKHYLPTFNQNCPKHFPAERPGFTYSKDATLNDMLILEHAWWEEVNKGLFGKQPARLDYIHVQGYCNFDFSIGARPTNEFTFLHLSMGKIYLFATRLSCIREKTHNEILLSWLHKYIPKRYDCEAVRSNTQSS